MKRKSGIKHYPLIGALLALCGAWVLHNFLMPDEADPQKYYQQIVANLHTELQEVSQQLPVIGQQLQDAEGFSDFQAVSDYPYFVYKEDSLYYWSDFRYVPPYSLIWDTESYKFVTDEGVQFIAQQVESAGYKIFMILPIHKTHNIQNNYVNAEFNQQVFPNGPSSVSLVPVGQGLEVHAPNGDYLFSLQIADQVEVRAMPVYYGQFVLISLSLVLFIYYLFQLISHQIGAHRYERAFLIFTLGLLSTRAAMLWFDFPRSSLNLQIFDPQYYASSDLNHSLGDLFLNELVLLTIVVFVFRYFKHFNNWLKTVSSSPLLQKIETVGWLWLSVVLLYFQYHIITLFYQSQWSLDIASIMDFSFFKLISLLIIIINAIIYFLVTHLALARVQSIWNRALRPLAISYLIALILFVVTALVLGWSWLVVVVLSTTYIALIYVLNITPYLGQFNYTSFLYLFIGALQCAVIGAYAVNTYEQVEEINGKQQLADQLLNERDIVGEFLLAEAMQKITQDRYIISQMLFNPFGSSDAILQKINRIYINQHLDRYDISVNLFDSRGDPDPQNDSFLRYQDYQASFAQESYASDYDQLYFINEITSDLLNRYLGFIEIKQNAVSVGYVIIDLKLKRVIPNTVYPELLVYNNQGESRSSAYSYAIYLKDTLINNSGSYNYAKDFDQDFFERESFYRKGIDQLGYHHYAVKGPSQRIAVITSTSYPLRNVLANFSFLFILMIFSIILYIAVFMTIRKRPVKLNYATRIQLYLNLAFFIPLLIVSVTTLSLISSSSKKEVIKQYFEKADGIRNNIVNPLNEYLEGNLEEELMAQDITEIALYSESDINLFSVQGDLISTSQPKIYDYKILSTQINPLAYHDIVEEQNNSVLLNEAVGTLNYKSAYVGIRSFGTGDLLGILSIPFFESKYELDKEIVVILTNILNVFTFIFIVILIASYFASRVLTVPLNLITQKIKKTTLTGYNEPLEWNSDDEIGLMVGEYNRMLKNLEASKRALARSEKESAWREMAQQVAHEIKNPLTPMKLTLQHLKRMLTTKSNTELSEKPINNLLHQIDTLSEIATSFSSFAKMPVPENQRIEISSILKRTVQLHSTNQDHQLSSKIEAGNHYVYGDPKLLGRIFSNLIINGIQAVPEERAPCIKVSLERVDNNVLIKIEDNGIGVPDDIKDKIFIPNFSTKETGSGIGLSIAKRGIEHAGGKIWFETEENLGTTILIELPLMD